MTELDSVSVVLTVQLDITGEQIEVRGFPSSVKSSFFVFLDESDNSTEAELNSMIDLCICRSINRVTTSLRDQSPLNARVPGNTGIILLSTQNLGFHHDPVESNKININICRPADFFLFSAGQEAAVPHTVTRQHPGIPSLSLPPSLAGIWNESWWCFQSQK